MKDRRDCIFDGKIEHLWCLAGGIHVDWFDYRDFKHQYFLSHAHKDHYAFEDKGEQMGLLTNTFISKLKKNPTVKIYCTNDTKNIVLKLGQTNSDLDIRELEKHIEVLNDDEKNREIKLISKAGKYSRKKIYVTTIPANHIPGAVMFLFEDRDENKRALYTGDFRYDVNEKNEEMKKLREFVESFEEVIDYLYVDTTFLDLGRLCHSDQNRFPSRPKITQKVIDLIKEKEPSSIHIDVTPMGSESVVRSVAGFLNISVDFIDAESESMKEVTKYLLRDIKVKSISPKPKKTTSIHIFNRSIFDVATYGKRDCCKCDKDTLRIRATVQWIFRAENYNHRKPDTWWNHADNALVREDRDFWQVLYSNHSSDYELREFLSHLKFSEIFPISEPVSRETWNGLVDEYIASSDSEESDSESYDSEETDSDEEEEDRHEIIRKSLYFTVESSTLRCPADYAINVLWLNETTRRDNSDLSRDGVQVSKKYFKNSGTIASVISWHKKPIDMITIPCTDKLEVSSRYLNNLMKRLSQRKNTADSILLFYSNTANRNGTKLKNIINSEHEDNPQVNYIDLTEIPEFRESISLETHIIIETLKNLARNSNTIMHYEDWPVPYEYSARKREYDLVSSRQVEVQPEIQKRSVTEVDEDSDETKGGNSKKFKGNTDIPES